MLSGLAVIVFFWVAFRKPKLIPGRTQSLGELGILAVRDQILRPALGRKGDAYLPFIVSLFFYILVCNLMELIPLLQFPVMSRIGFVWPLVFMMYGLYWYLGFKAKGFFGYFRSWIPAAPWPILIILIPVEILKYVIVQPFTLGVRLFANMFAGHLLLSIFMVATWYLASFSVGLLYAAGLAVHGVLRLPARAPGRPPAGVHLHHAYLHLHRGLAGAPALSLPGSPADPPASTF